MSKNDDDDDKSFTFKLPTLRGTVVPHPPSIITGIVWTVFVCWIVLMCAAAINMSGLTPALSAFTGGSVRAIATNVPPVMGAGFLDPGRVIWDTGVQIWTNALAQSPYSLVPRGGLPQASSGQVGAPTTAPITVACPQIRSTSVSQEALQAYQGVDAVGANLADGADLQKALELGAKALEVNCGDLLGGWVYDHTKPLVEQANGLREASSLADLARMANDMLSINPRVMIAYYAPRWASLQAWIDAPNDEATKELFAGLEMTITEQSNKGSIANLPDKDDRFRVVIHSPGFALADLTVDLSWDQLNLLFGEVNTFDRTLNQGAWKIDANTSVVVPGQGPVPIPQPAVIGPSETELSVATPIPPTPIPAPVVESPPVATATPAEGVGGGGEGRTHTVSVGENLYRISLKYGVTVQAIKSANGLISDVINVGQVLTIPSP